jgi:3-hydroxyacyl-[acyl-carrier-protein] dehydratase
MDPVETLIPHREPFLFIDQVLAYDSGSRQVVGQKTVSPGDPYLVGHYPGRPIMPGVLLLEALVQTMTAGLAMDGTFKGGVALLADVDRCHFRRPVNPGDVVRLEVTIKQVIGSAARGSAIATVDGNVVAEAVITLVIEA